MSVTVISRGLHDSTEFPITQGRDGPIDPRLGEVIELRERFSISIRRECLFRPAKSKTHLYRVESGCLCVYQPHSGEHRAIVEFAFAGDLLGLGYLENHTRTARAIGQTRIACLPLDAVDRIVEASPGARDQLKKAIDDELEFVRDGLVTSGQRNPIERVAAFFVALSRGNSYDGRVPNIITNSLTCGVVAQRFVVERRGFGPHTRRA